jgi:hypothetical protein
VVLAVDRKNGSLVFPCQWGGAPSYKMIRGCRFYLEDKPQYLDSPGEFWFDKKGDGGRLCISVCCLGMLAVETQGRQVTNAIRNFCFIVLGG